MKRGRGRNAAAGRERGADDAEVIDGLRPVCVCKGIRKKVFLNHIAAGLRTEEELRKATGAGRGSCKGERCTPKIRELLEQHRKK